MIPRNLGLLGWLYCIQASSIFAIPCLLTHSAKQTKENKVRSFDLGENEFKNIDYYSFTDSTNKLDNLFYTQVRQLVYKAQGYTLWF